MNFFHENAAITQIHTQVHAAAEFMDVVCQLAIPAGFLLVIALFILHLSNCISSHQPTQSTSKTASVAHQSLTGQHTELTCSVDDAPLASQVCQLACAVPQALSTFTIRQLKKMASAYNQAHPQQKIQNLRKLTKSQLIERLSQTTDLTALEVMSNG